MTIWSATAKFITMNCKWCCKLPKDSKSLVIILSVYLTVTLPMLFFARQILSPDLWSGASMMEYAEEFVNILPFQSIISLLHSQSTIGLFSLLTHLFIGVFPGIITGLILPSVVQKISGRFFLCSSVSGFLTFFYTFRLMFRCGTFDIDDIILDILGFYLGIRLSTLVNEIQKMA